MKKNLLLYIPVLHAGYLHLLEEARASVEDFFILDDTFVEELHPLHKEIRALPAERMRRIIQNMNLFARIHTLTTTNLSEIKKAPIITADEHLIRVFIEKYLPDALVEYRPVFLRWDEKNVKSDVSVQYDRISTDATDQRFVQEAKKEAEKSGDWWRHVGAVIVKDGAIMMRDHNHHVPSDHTPYALGDPRDVVEPGTSPELYTSIHAEQSLVAEAAKRGMSLEGTSMYMNIFPCPPCAKIMAAAGIKKCYFETGSAWLDAESVLRAHGVEIILVKNES